MVVGRMIVVVVVEVDRVVVDDGVVGVGRVGSVKDGLGNVKGLLVPRLLMMSCPSLTSNTTCQSLAPLPAVAAAPLLVPYEPITCHDMT